MRLILKDKYKMNVLLRGTKAKSWARKIKA